MTNPRAALGNRLADLEAQVSALGTGPQLRFSTVELDDVGTVPVVGALGDGVRAAFAIPGLDKRISDNLAALEVAEREVKEAKAAAEQARADGLAAAATAQTVADEALTKAAGARTAADDATAKATDATTKADGALATAATARETADAAKAAGAAAQAAADGAKADAGTALERAAAANTAAGQANTAATTAKSAADAARADADAANTAAGVARERADEANALAATKSKNWPTAATPPAPGTAGLAANDTFTRSTDGALMRYTGSRWDVVPLATQSYVQSRGTNLVTNGSALLGDNTNFSGFDFDATDHPVGAAAAFTSTKTAILADELIPVDPAMVYELTFAARQMVAGGAPRFYSLIAPYDADGLTISTQQSGLRTGTLTTLAQPLRRGDTTVTLTSAAGWGTGTASIMYLAVYGYTDGKGYTWPDGVYTRQVQTYGSISGNVLTLNAPWAGNDAPAGRAVGNSFASGTYIYPHANLLLGTEWTNYAGRISGVHTQANQSWDSRLPVPTAAIKIGFLPNRGTPPSGSRQGFANVALNEVTLAAAAQAAATTAQASADGKTTNTSSPLAASATVPGKTTGDTWWQIDGNGSPVNRWVWTGTTWSVQRVSNALIDALDAAKITTGYLDAARIAANTITAAMLSANSVTATKIAADAVTAGKIAANAITTRELAAGSVTAETLAAAAVTAGKIAAGAIVAADIAANTITGAKIAAATITGDRLVANTITAAQIGANVITAAQIAAGAITTATLAADAVTSAKIAANAITAREIAAATITAAQIAAATLTARELAADSVTAAKIAADAVVARNIAAAAVTAGKIAAAAVTTANLAAGAVTAEKIAAGTITAQQIAAGAITANELAADAINGRTITGVTVNGGEVNGAKLRTATSGKRIEIVNDQIVFWSGQSNPDSPGQTYQAGIIQSLDVVGSTGGIISIGQLAIGRSNLPVSGSVALRGPSLYVMDELYTPRLLDPNDNTTLLPTVRGGWAESSLAGGSTVSAGSAQQQTVRSFAIPSNRRGTARIFAQCYMYRNDTAQAAGSLYVRVEGNVHPTTYRMHTHGRAGGQARSGYWEIDLSPGQHSIQVGVRADANSPAFEVWDLDSNIVITY